MSWILKMSFSNMKKRRMRTFLTILGVVIGTVSIVSMISVGMGYSRSVMAEIVKQGNPTEIRVYDNAGTNRVERKDRKITEKTIGKIEELEGVKNVYPVISIEGELKLGKYETYTTIMGVPQEYLETKGLMDGTYPEYGKSKPDLVAGQGIAYILFNSYSGVSYHDTMTGGDTFTNKKVDFTYYNEPDSETLLEAEQVEKDASPAGNEQTPVTEADEESSPSYEDYLKNVKLNIVGTTDNEYDYYIYTEIESLKKYVRRNKAGNSIPGQPLDKDGKAINEWIYSGLILEAESVDDVDRISKAISNLGFRAENNKEGIKSAEKTAASVKVLLGIVGMIALVVAVIGIVNTMSTAVYDRMQEIGTLKLIGCDSDDILFMFLFESGVLGAMGGTVGVIISFLVNHFIIDKKVPAMLELPKEIYVTYMPWWLVCGAIVFAIVISVIAGLIPARYAAGLRPLEAATTT